MPQRLRTLPGDAGGAAERYRCQEQERASQASQETLDQGSRSANAAEQATLISYYQAGVAFWQTYATFCAFVAAVFAALYAKHAADHTKRGADAAEAQTELVKATERAYLYVVTDGIKGGAEVTDGMFLRASGASGALAVVNVGAGPAVITDFWIKYRKTIPEGDAPFADGYQPSRDSFPIPVKSGDSESFRVIGLTFPDRSVVFGEVRYTDVFQSARSTRFCIQIDPRNLGMSYVGPAGWNERT